MPEFRILDLDAIGTIRDLHGDQALTGDEVRAEVGRVTAMMAALGVGAGSMVVISHGGTPSFFVDLFATWQAGACAVCTNASLTPEELERIVSFVDADLVTTRPGIERGEKVGSAPVHDFSTVSESLPAPKPASGVLNLDGEAKALILFTSGTTGHPKGVVHTGRSLSERIRWNRSEITDHEMYRTLCVLPTHFGHGLIGNCLTPLAAGSDLLLFPSPGVAGCARLGQILSDHRVTFMSSVPSLWKVVLRMAPATSLPDLRRVHVGSAPLSDELWGEISEWCGGDVPVWNMYGLTETANWTAGASYRDDEVQDGLVGTMWGGRAGVRDEQGVIHLYGRGEIVLDTPSLMAGYYKRPDLTSKAIVDGWYRTGDFGTVDEDGTIRLLGRLKTEINRAGTKILPEEIDLLLERHPDVAEACTFGVPDAINGESVAVAVKLRENSDSDANVLRAWCLERIRRECVPESWFLVDEIPKTDRGKINRETVRLACTAKT